MNLHRWIIGVVAALLWAVGVGFMIPSPRVGLTFERDVERATVCHITEPSGHFHLEVRPKEAAAKISALTIAGVPVFSRNWLVYSVSSSVPLGESEVVDFPRFFDLLPKLFRIVRISVAAFPFLVLILIAVIRYVFPILKRRCGYKAFVGILAVASLLSLPEPVVDYSPGLDPSWSWFLCHFAFHNVFGSEVVFTYGPLGFLLLPQESWACVLCSLAANIIFLLLWCVLLINIYRKSDVGRCTAWILATSLVIPMPMEWRWTLLAVLLTASLFYVGERRATCWYLPGVLASVVGMMKFSSLTIVVGSQIFCMLALLMRYRRGASRAVLAYVGALLVSGMFLSLMCFSSVSTWVDWLRGALATASGYNLYMVAEKQWFELLIPVFIFVVFVWAVGWRWCILFSPILFLTAKYAWVRQSSGPMAYAAAVLAAVSLLGGVKRVRVTIGLTVFALVLNVALALPSALSGLADMQSISGVKPIAFWHTLTLPQAVQASLARSVNAVAQSRLSSTLRARIGNGSVVFLPYEYGSAMADSTLNVRPLPSLQLYSACHPYLDSLNADIFEKQVSDFVVCEITANGSGYFINYPRMWTALLENYEYVDSDARFALMSKRSKPRSRPTLSITLSNSVAVIDKVRGVFFRNPIEHAFLASGTGVRVRFQLVRGNQGVAFPLEWIPLDDDDMRAILRGGKGRVATISYSGD